ncbi:MAG: tyrosine-type recombinase/integrase [Rhodothermales bacterium]
MATIRKTPAGNYQVIIKKRGKTLKTKTFKLKKNARQWAHKVEGDTDLIALYGSDGATVTFSALADEYDKWWSPNHNSKGLNARLGFWRDLYGPERVIEITPGSIRSALATYRKSHSPASTNRVRSCLSSVFSFAIKQRGYVTTNPVLQVPSITEENKRKRYLSDDERKALIIACKASDWEKLYLLVTLALTTGARLSEILWLRWSDIDFSNRTALIHKTKNGESRTLTIPHITMEELLQFRQIGNGLVFAGSRKFNQPFEFRRHWNKALNDAEINDFRFHVLRHSAASYLAMSGASLVEIAEILGHKSLETTKRYSHLSVEHKKKLTDRVLGTLDL